MAGKRVLLFDAGKEKRDAVSPLLGLAMVAAVLKTGGREVTGCQFKEDMMPSPQEHVDGSAPDVIGHSRLEGFVDRVRRTTREKGVAHVVRSSAEIVRHRVSLRTHHAYHRLFRSWRSFTFMGKEYRYFYHPYNKTWSNERTMEIPIVWRILEENRGKSVLEVGNVLSHYFEVSHDIVDKYERSDGVINLDIVDYQPDKRYDLIVSISTLEHIGWDENLREKSDLLGKPWKTLQAVDSLKACLAPGGMIVATFPVGYNPQLDRAVDEGKLHFTETHCMKRVTKGNRWVEASWDEIRGSKYGEPFLAANGLLVCFVRGG